jgi:hypothetical protein
MKLIRNLTILFLCNINYVLAQAPDTLWTKKIGGTGTDVGNEIIQTSDGSFVIAGYTTSFGAIQRDSYIIKLDSSGSTVWANRYGGNDYEIATSVKESHDEGYIFAIFFSTASNISLQLIKVNSAGDTLWTKFEGTPDDEVGSNLQTTDDGGFLVTGYTDADALTNGKRDVWLVKFDSLGNKLWEKTFGGTEDDSGSKILKLSDGNLLIPGYTHSFSSGSDRDGWIVKTDPSGNFIWSKSYSASEYDDFTAAAEDDNGNLYLTGTSVSSGNRNIWLVKTDPLGNHIFTKTYGGSDEEWGYDIKRANDGNFIVTGSNRSNSSGLAQLWLLKIDDQGDTLWTKLFTSVNGSIGYSVIQTADDGLAVTGTAAISGAGPEVWAIRLKAEGSTSVDDNIFTLPETFFLEQNYPNPFNPTTKIGWQSPFGSHQVLKVFDVLGNEVATLVDEYKPAGSYEVEFNGSELSSGIYYYKLTTDFFSDVKKMLILK